MTPYEQTRKTLRSNPRTWLVTGVAGFIGSNLLEALLKLDQDVVGLDNLDTGHRRNLDEVLSLVGEEQKKRFTFVEGDIRHLPTCQKVCSGVDHVLHQAALGSVPRSIEDPLATHASNVTGTLNMLLAARDAGVKRFVYASSSALYGDHPDLPKVEERIGNPLSPYAVSKLANELYAMNFSRTYGLETMGLRYFNVFGPRQDPEGPYAAVIPRWVIAMMHKEPLYINGTGETSRDFCFVENVIQINLLAATTTHPEAPNQTYNVALNSRKSLKDLFETLRTGLLPDHPHLENFKPIHRDFRPGDVLHSQADISRAQKLLGYQPTHTLEEGLQEALAWYAEKLGKRQ